MLISIWFSYIYQIFVTVITIYYTYEFLHDNLIGMIQIETNFDLIDNQETSIRF